MTLKPHSFASRLTRWITLTVLLTMTAVSLLILHLVTEAVAAGNNVNAIEKALSRGEDIQIVLAEELRLNPQVVGCGVGFIPNYFPEEGRWYEPYAVRRGNGNIEVSQIGSEYHDYLKSDWYINAMKRNQGYWSDPYYDSEGGCTMMCTYAHPVYTEDGVLVGAFGSDISLEWLTKQLVEIEKKSETYGWLKVNKINEEVRPYSFIISRTGEYVVHPETFRVLAGNMVNEAKHTDTDIDDKLAHKMIHGETGYMTLDIDGRECIVFYSPLKRTEWSMAIVVPRVLILMPAYILSTMVLVLMLIGLIIVFFVSRVAVRRIAKPLGILAASADEVAKGHFDTPLPVLEHDDEISHLRDSFEKMQTSLADYIEKLKESAAQKASYESELNIARDIQTGTSCKGGWWRPLRLQDSRRAPLLLRGRRQRQGRSCCFGYGGHECSVPFSVGKGG